MRKTLCILLLLLCGCTSARWSAFKALNKSHHIKQFSGGQLVGEWDSVGVVQSEDKSDGYFFEDRKTNKLIVISGDVQVTIND